MRDLMIDLETLDTGDKACILAIGAVKFDLASGQIDDNGLYVSISIDSNLDHGRTISESTLLWWLKQSTEAQRVFHEPKTTLSNALDTLTDWIGTDEICLWGNGPSFDLAKLASAYDDLDKTKPWIYWNERCVRTYRSLPGAKNIPKVAPTVKHHALADAYAQAQHMINIRQILFAAQPEKVTS
jgi:exodeoxyribonuclease VIII